MKSITDSCIILPISQNIVKSKQQWNKIALDSTVFIQKDKKVSRGNNFKSCFPLYMNVVQCKLNILANSF